MSQSIFYPAYKRGHANHGWLDTYHSFSFAGYHDPNKVHFGMLRVLNDDTILGGYGFGTHPHDNMEIITIVLKGALEHKDSMGHTEAINAGEVQVMSAGTGLQHSEYNHYPDQECVLFQIWIFPKFRNVKPRYDQRKFDEAGRTDAIQTLVSPMETTEDSLKIHQDAWIYRTILSKGKLLDLKLKQPGNGWYIMVISGNIELAGKTLLQGDAIGIWENPEIGIIANETSDILIIEIPM